MADPNGAPNLRGRANAVTRGKGRKLGLLRPPKGRAGPAPLRSRFATAPPVKSMLAAPPGAELTKGKAERAPSAFPKAPAQFSVNRVSVTRSVGPPESGQTRPAPAKPALGRGPGGTGRSATATAVRAYPKPPKARK
jgi:hypothetical protein